MRKTERVWECKRHVEGGGGVASKLQKKLIKNEKREREEEVGQGRREWTEVGGRMEGEGKRGRKKEKRKGKKSRREKQFFIENGWTNSA